jgi:hypothetical protein
MDNVNIPAVEVEFLKQIYKKKWVMLSGYLK